MKVAHTALVRALRARVWKLVTDVPAVARCVPGVAAVTPSGAGKFKGSLLVQLGPVRLVLDGDVALTATDEAAGKASVRADAKDSASAAPSARPWSSRLSTGARIAS